MAPGSSRRGDKEYRYSRCVQRDRYGTAACPAKPLPAPAVEKVVVDEQRQQ
jgi:site-specific DNA recombinase